MNGKCDAHLSRVVDAIVRAIILELGYDTAAITKQNHKVDELIVIPDLPASDNVWSNSRGRVRCHASNWGSNQTWNARQALPVAKTAAVVANSGHVFSTVCNPPENSVCLKNTNHVGTINNKPAAAVSSPVRASQVERGVNAASTDIAANAHSPAVESG